MNTDSKWWRVTRYTIVALILIAGVYDVIAYAAGGWSSTISRQLLGGASIAPAIPLALGFILGHIFWPQPPYDNTKEK